MFQGCGRESGDNRVGQFVCTARVPTSWTGMALLQFPSAEMCTKRNHLNWMTCVTTLIGPLCPTWDLKVSSGKREFCTTTRLVFSFFPVSMRPRLKRRPALVVQLKRVKWLVCRTAQPPWTPSCLDFPVPRDPENSLFATYASWKHTHL